MHVIAYVEVSIISWSRFSPSTFSKVQGLVFVWFVSVAGNHLYLLSEFINPILFFSM